MGGTNICFVIDNIVSKGGTERALSTLANNLSANYQVTIASMDSCKGDSFFKLSSNIKVSHLGNKSTLQKKDFFKKKFDVCIVISMGKLSVFISFLFFIFNIKCKLLLSEHGSFERYSSFVKWIKVISFKLASSVVLLTEHDKKVVEGYGVNNVNVIPNASSFSIENNKVINNKSNIVLAIGHLNSGKNFARLLDIWSKINRRDWKLIIVGDGPENAYLKLKIDSLFLNDSVEIHPPTKLISDYYKKASILLMTSKYEAF
jgi:amylovoran biosynthesis glycosyltransferase AmsD